MIISTLLKLNVKRVAALTAFALATVAGLAQTADTLVLNNAGGRTDGWHPKAALPCWTLREENKELD